MLSEPRWSTEDDRSSLSLPNSFIIHNMDSILKIGLIRHGTTMMAEMPIDSMDLDSMA